MTDGKADTSSHAKMSVARRLAWSVAVVGMVWYMSICVVQLSHKSNVLCTLVPENSHNVHYHENSCDNLVEASETGWPDTRG